VPDTILLPVCLSGQSVTELADPILGWEECQKNVWPFSPYHNKLVLEWKKIPKWTKLKEVNDTCIFA
jgi:hypothetical protein